MGVPISNVTRRVVYSASGTGPYSFTFEILANTDIAVYKDDTLLTLTTDYTVTINANGTGSITLTTSPTGATQIAIVGNRTIQRTSDFVTGGDFFANTVNTELDQQTIFAQQNAEGLARALQAPQTDPVTVNMTLPRAALRAGKNLAFDAQGNPTLGDTLGTNRGNWSAGVLYFVRDIVKDTSNNNIYQCLVQHTSTGSQPISTNTDAAKWSLLVDAGTATTSATNAANSATSAAASATLANDWATKTSSTVAGGEYSAKYHAQAAATSASSASSSASSASTSASSASTSATNAASSATAAAASAAAAAASYDSFDDRYLGTKTSDPTLDNDGNALVTGALYYRTTAPIGMKVYDGATWIAASAASVQVLTTFNYTATGGQTTFTGADDNATTLAYTAGCVLVTKNGVLLEVGSEVTATNGTSVVLASGAVAGDEVNVIAFSQFAIADAVLKANNLSDLPNKATARTNLGVAIGTDVQAYDANTAKTNVTQSFTKAQRGTPVALTDGATITPDFSAGNNFSVTLGGNRTLANPTNLTAGQHGSIVITQDGTGSRTLAYGTYWKFPTGTAPTLTTTASAVDVLVYYVESATRITARLVSDVK